jgi:3-deoxy-manno-octulosonate cytidylyltransferase (CMP-KDO synthetase)
MQISAPSSNSSPSSGSGARLWVLHGLALGTYLYRWPSGFRSRAVGIIPARFASTRFEGKPLVHILGKPMIQVRLLALSYHIFQRARRSLL